MPTTTKASDAVLKMRRTGSGAFFTVGTNMGRGVVNATRTQRTINRTSADGRPIVRRLNVFDVTIITDVRDKADTRRLFGWFDGAGRVYDVEWFPEGEVTGKLKRAFSGPVMLTANLSEDRVMQLTVTASGPITDTTVS